MEMASDQRPTISNPQADTNKNKAMESLDNFQGDIKLAPNEKPYSPLLPAGSRATEIQHGDVIIEKKRKWEMPIKYSYASNLPLDSMKGWEDALKDLTAKARYPDGSQCFSFQPVNPNYNQKHLHIVNRGGMLCYQIFRILTFHAHFRCGRDKD